MSTYGVETNITLNYSQEAQQNFADQQLRLTFTGPKLHGLKITESALHYHGSISIDSQILEKAGLFPLEFVHVWNKASGTRIQTYILPATRGSGTVCLNGAAARSCQTGDEVIVTAERSISGSAAITKGFDYKSLVLTFRHDERVNSINEILEYHVWVDEEGAASFSLNCLE